MLAIKSLLLPKPLRPNWFNRIGLILAGVFFTFLGIMASIQLYNDRRLELLHEATKEARMQVVSVMEGGSV